MQLKTWLIPASLVVFACVSLVTIGSVRPDLLTRQLVFFLLGGGVYVLCVAIPFARWLRWRWWLYAATLGLLVLPLLLGHSSRNTSRWIELGLFRLQPSQLVIPLTGLVAVWLLGKGQPTVTKLAVFFCCLLPPAALIFISPDLGTTVVFAASLMSLLWFVGTPLRLLVGLLAGGLILALVSWTIILKPYQRERMLSFIAGTAQEEEQHYNATQALIAVGGGEVWGTGWGEGTQAHLLFLPEPQTDFIFSSFAQEYGLVGTSALLGVVTLVVIYLLVQARRANDRHGALYLNLAALTLALQAGINIGMNIGLLPITGVTLPFISYGGSSIVAMSLMLGISDSVVRSQPRVQPQLLGALPPTRA